MDTAAYFFRFIAASRLAFGDWETHQKREQKGVRNNYLADKAEMMAFDRRIEKYNFFHHYGLNFDVRVEARSKEEGLIRAEALVLNFISTLCFLEKCFIESPKCILSYRYPIGNDKWLNEYQALLIDDKFYQPNEDSLIIVDCGNLNFFIQRIITANIDMKNAIYFALHWFWKAASAKDKRDRFINLWVALEILETPLKKFYGLSSVKISCPVCKSCKEEISLCPNCKKDFNYSVNSGFTGYKKLEKKISDREVIGFNKLHGLRSALVHSGGNLSVKNIDDAIFSTRVLINSAILTLLDFPNSITDGILMARSEFRATSLPLRMEFKGLVKVKEIASIDDIDKQPSVSAEYSYSFNIKDGDLISNCDVKHTFNDIFEEGKVEKVVKIDTSHNVKDLWERQDK